MCVCLRQKVTISAPDKAVFSCLAEIFGKSFIPMITALGGFHKDKVYRKLCLLYYEGAYSNL